MIIVENCPTAELGYDDPRFELAREQMNDRLEELRRIVAAEGPCERRFEAADILCESTRDVLFRLHRVSAEQLRDIVRLFEEAAELVRRVASEDSSGDPEGYKDVQGYLRHIEGRIDLLRQRAGELGIPLEEPAGVAV